MPLSTCLRALVATLVLAGGSGTAHAFEISFHTPTWDVSSKLRLEIAALDPEELERRGAELERRLTDDPHDSEAFDALLLVVERRLREHDRQESEAREVCGRAPASYDAAAAAREARIRSARQAVVGRWLANVPDDPRPYLAALPLASSDEEREHLVEDAIAHAPDDIRGHWANAERLAREHQVDRGAALLESFLDHHPDDPQAYEALVEYQRTRDRDAARRWLTAWTARFPDDPVALQHAIELRSDRLSEPEIERLARAAVDRHPHLLELPELCGRIRAWGRLDAAEACSRAVVRRADDEHDDRTSTAARIELVQILMDRDRDEQLAQQLARLRDDPRGVKALVDLAGDTVHGANDVRFWGDSRAGTPGCRRALRLVDGIDGRDVSDLYTRATLAGVLALCGQTARARPLVASLVRERRLGQLIDLAGILASLPDTEEHEAALLDRARSEPGCAVTIYEMLAKATEGRRDPAAAIRYLEAWAAADPTDVRALQDLVTVAQRAGKTEEAIEAHRELVRRHPEDPGPRAGLGWMLMEAGRTEEAAAIADELERSAKTSMSASSAHNLRAEIARRQGHPEAEAAAWQRYFAARDPAAYPSYSEILRYLTVLLDLSRLDTVTQFLAAEFDRQVAAGHARGSRGEFLAEWYRRLGLVERADEQLDRLAESPPQDARGWVRRAALLKGAGRRQEAEEAYRAALRLDQSEGFTRLQLADMLWRDGEWLEVVALLEPEVEGRTIVDPAVAARLAWSYRASCLGDLARDVLARVEVDRVSATGDLFLIGEVHEMLNQSEEAASCYRRLLERTDGNDCLSTSPPHMQLCREMAEHRAHAVEFLSAHSADIADP